MARTIPCDEHPTTEAALLVTQQATGDVQALCLTCVPDWAAFLLMTTSGDQDPGERLAQIVEGVLNGAQLVTLDADPAPASSPFPDPVSGDETDADSAADGALVAPVVESAGTVPEAPAEASSAPDAVAVP